MLYITGTHELSVDTFGKNLKFFASIGEVALENIVPSEKTFFIREAIRIWGAVSPGRLKLSLGDSVTYGEIRLVVAGLE